MPQGATRVRLFAGHYLTKRRLTDIPARHERTVINVPLADRATAVHTVLLPTTVFVERSWRLWKVFHFGKNKVGEIGVSVETERHVTAIQTKTTSRNGRHAASAGSGARTGSPSEAAHAAKKGSSTSVLTASGDASKSAVDVRTGAGAGGGEAAQASAAASAAAKAAAAQAARRQARHRMEDDVVSGIRSLRNALRDICKPPPNPDAPSTTVRGSMQSDISAHERSDAFQCVKTIAKLSKEAKQALSEFANASGVVPDMLHACTNTDAAAAMAFIETHKCACYKFSDAVWSLQKASADLATHTPNVSLKLHGGFRGMYDVLKYTDVAAAWSVGMKKRAESLHKVTDKIHRCNGSLYANKLYVQRLALECFVVTTELTVRMMHAPQRFYVCVGACRIGHGRSG